MALGATSVLSVICPQLHGASHLLGQNQAMGQNATWRTIRFAQQFIEALLTASVRYTEEADESFLQVPQDVTYKLQHLYHQLKRRSSKVQGSARSGLSLCLD